jgi:hypothetical protein
MGVFSLVFVEYKSIAIMLGLIGLGIIISFIPVYNHSFVNVLNDEENNGGSDGQIWTERYSQLLQFSIVIAIPMICHLALQLALDDIYYYDFHAVRRYLVNFLVMLAIMCPVSMLNIGGAGSAKQLSVVLCTSILQQMFLFAAFLFAFHPMEFNKTYINGAVVPMLFSVYILTILLEGVGVEDSRNSNILLAVLAFKIVLYVCILVYVMLWMNYIFAKSQDTNGGGTDNNADIQRKDGDEIAPTNTFDPVQLNFFCLSSLSDSLPIARNIIIFLAVLATCTYSNNYATLTVQNSGQVLEHRALVFIATLMFLTVIQQTEDYLTRGQLKVKLQQIINYFATYFYLYIISL